jgi:hypothetical protein
VQVLTYGREVNDAESTTYVVWGLGDSAPDAWAPSTLIGPR